MAARATLLVLVVAALYGLAALRLAQIEGFWSGDAGVKLWQMEAWIASGWRTAWAPYAQTNRALDPDHELAPLGPPFAVWQEDRVLTIYTLPYIFASSLLFSVGGRQALVALPLLAGIAGLAVAAWQGSRFSGRVAGLAVLVLGLATPWLFYSLTFWGHTLASLLVWLALALVLPDPAGQAHGWISGAAAGLLLGGAIAVRPEAAVCSVAAVIVLAAFGRTRRIMAWVVLGLVAAVLAALVYQAQVVQGPIGGQAAMNFEPGAFESGFWSADRLIEMSQIVVEISQPGVLVIAVGGGLLFAVAYAYRRLRPGGLHLLPEAVGLLALLLAAVGIFVLLVRGHAPIDLLTGAPVVWLLLTQLSHASSSTRWRGPVGQLAAWIGLVVLLSVGLGRQDGGLQWGPRYLTAVMGPLVLLSVARWDALDRAARRPVARWGLRFAFLSLALAGVATQAAGVVRLGEVQAANEALALALLDEPACVVVTDIWFVPQIAPSVYGQVPFLLVRTSEEWAELDSRLERQGIERLRLARLRGQATALSSALDASWSHVEGSTQDLATDPPLSVVDYVRRMEQ
jgi:hypothetical protein